MPTLEEIVKLLAEENRIGFEKLRKSQEKSDEGFEKMRKNQEKSDEGFEKLRKSLDDLRKSHKKLESFFNTQWGKLVEALVKNQVVPLLQERGIPVNQTIQRVEGKLGDGNIFEFDIIAENGDSIVVIEVKTTLRPDDVPHFLDKLSNFKTWLPRYSDVKVYGAVAFLHQDSHAAANAAKAGLFTILAAGASAFITNPNEFKPKEF